MKNNLFAAAALTCLLVLAPLQMATAQEMSNSVRLTPKGQFSLGLSMSYLFEQKNDSYDLTAKSSDGGSSTGKYAGKIKDDQYYLLGLAYGLTDWFNLFAQAGLAHGGIFVSPNLANNEEWETKMKDQFVWALGAKAQAFKLQNGLALGLSARYLRYDDRKLGQWRDNNTGYDDSADSLADERLDYWQLDLSAVLSFPLGPLTPYAGLGYTYAEAKESGRSYNLRSPSYTEYDATIKNQDQLLALCGFDLALGHGLSLYMEGEFVARTTLGLGLAWSF